MVVVDTTNVKNRRSTRGSLWWIRFQQLNWLVPFYSYTSASTATPNAQSSTTTGIDRRRKQFQAIPPHGICGILSLFFGFYLIGFGQLSNSLSVYRTIVPYLYVFFTVCNAIAGYAIAYKAPNQLITSIFKTCSVFQLAASYYVLRFLPIFYYHVSYENVLRYTDTFMALLFVGIACSFMYISFKVFDKMPYTSIGIAVASMSLYTTACYPMQLMFEGQQWLDNIMEHRYPNQDIVFSAYVYLPVTLFFSIMLFGTTLYLRKIISDVAFGALCSVTVIFVVVTTTVASAIQLPKPKQIAFSLYLPYPEPEIHSTKYYLEEYTDVFPIVLAFMNNYYYQYFVLQPLGLAPIVDHDSYRP